MDNWIKDGQNIKANYEGRVVQGRVMSSRKRSDGVYYNVVLDRSVNHQLRSVGMTTTVEINAQDLITE